MDAKPLAEQPVTELDFLLSFMRCLAPFSCDRKGEGECYVCEAKRVIVAQRKELERLRMVEQRAKAVRYQNQMPTRPFPNGLPCAVADYILHGE